MINISVEQLARSTGATMASASRFLPHIVKAMNFYDIATPVRAAAFLAQVGEESGSLRYTAELWGPTPAQTTYERDFAQPWGPVGRNEKPFRLGNVNRGDGRKYKGHGLLQTTGRGNHIKVRDRLRQSIGPHVPDFEAQPQALEEPEWAAFSAGDYWDMRKLNPIADAGDFETITRRINGGLTRYEHRLALWAAAKVAFGVTT